MTTFKSALNKQWDLMVAVAQTIPKFKKLAIPKRTALTIQRRIDELKTILPQIREHNATLRTLATDEELKLQYFTDNQFQGCIDDYEPGYGVSRGGIGEYLSSSSCSRSGSPG